MAEIGKPAPNPASPRHRFSSHADPDFIEFVRGRVHRRCSRLNVSVYKDRQAELRLEEEARAAIAEAFQEAWPDAWFPVTVRRDWPAADCIIKGDRAFIRIAFSPETSALQGGEPIEAIEVFAQRPPQSIWKRTLNAVAGKPVTDPEVDLAPIGSATGQPAQKPPPAPQPTPPKPAPRPTARPRKM